MRADNGDVAGVVVIIDHLQYDDDSVEVTGYSGPWLDCEGELDWDDVVPGTPVSDSFTVENVGENESLLDWEIKSYPEWGTWTFNPENGTDLTPEDGAVTISVSVEAPGDSETEFTGEIKELFGTIHRFCRQSGRSI